MIMIETHDILEFSLIISSLVYMDEWVSTIVTLLNLCYFSGQ